MPNNAIEKWNDPLFYTGIPYLFYKEARLDEAVELIFDSTRETRMRIYEAASEEKPELKRCAICFREFDKKIMDRCELKGKEYYLCKPCDSKEMNHGVEERDPDEEWKSARDAYGGKREDE